MNLNGKVSRLSLDEMQMNFPPTRRRVDHNIKMQEIFKATWNTNRGERENGSPKNCSTLRLHFHESFYYILGVFTVFKKVKKNIIIILEPIATLYYSRRFLDL